MRRVLFSLCLIVAAFPAFGKLFNAEEFFLDNGLQVVVVENHKAPLIKQMLWYKAGAIDEVPGKGGSAHLLEHLMFRGTDKLKDGEFNEVMKRHGAVSNAFTSHEVTAYHQFADISRLEVLMALEADRMQNINFNEQAFETERKIVFQERKQVVENDPSSSYDERLRVLLWGATPYANPVTGTNTEIQALSFEDIMDFYRRFYAPNNALLVLSGDIDADTARNLAEKYYGAIKSSQISRDTPAIISDKFVETLEMKLPEINAVKAEIVYLLPPHRQLRDALYDYIVLAQYLGGGETSALYEKLVLTDKSSVGIGAAYNFTGLSNTVFKLHFLPSSDETFSASDGFSEIETAMDEAIKKLSAKRLESIKRKLLADLVYVNDNPEDAAEWVGIMLTSGFTLDEIQNYEAKIKAVTLSGVQKAYENLRHAASVRGVLRPIENQSGKGRAR